MTAVSHPVHPNAMRRSAWRTVGRILRCAALAIPPLALGFELWTHACMNLLIDPIPSWGHAALVALVPIAMLRAHRSLTGPRSDRDRVQIDTALLATACGISLAYCAGMLPIIGMALLVFVYLPIIAFFVAAAALRPETLGELRGFAIAPGLALLALAPVIGLLTSATYYARLRRRVTAPIGHRFVRFFLLGFALFALAEIPGAAAHYGLSPHSATDDSALRIAVLRALTTEPAMIRAARFGPHNAHVWGWLLDRAFRGGRPFAEGSIYEPGADEKRFFRVTGKSLRGAPAVRLVGNSTPAAGWIEETSGSFDALQGGDEVGRGLGDVHWVGSELGGELHPDGEFAYLEWTLVFRNVGVRAREARALLQLPEGAVVSRTTLWVNGEEREGSFASKSATRAAYESVVRERRDPLLVSANRVDEVLVQCFPVPPNGGEMKIRIGITAPLLPHGSDDLALSLPYFIEQNFARSEEVDQRIELRSPEGGVEVAAGAARVARGPVESAIWVPDPRSSDGLAIRQRWTDRTEAGASRSLIVAVDASKGVKRHVPELVAGLRELAREHRLEILLAADEPEWLGDDPAVLERISFQGGHENHSALELAIARMRERQAQAEVPALLWIHAPRPVVLKGTYTLHDALRKEIRGPLFHFALEPGPNRLWSELEQGVAAGAVPLARLRGVARAGGVADDLRAFGEALRSGAADRVALRERGQPSARGTESLREATSRAAVHLTRLWAWEESRRLAGHPARDEAAASVLAARYELVTPWSGAVVLETDDEYRAASIPIPRRDSDDPTLGTASLDEPRSEASSEEQLAASSRTQPAIPEPSGALLFAVGCAVVCLCRRKSSRR